MTDFTFAEIADVICRSHLAMYADPHGLHRDDKPNKWGIIVEFSEKTRQIRFSFVTRHDEPLQISYVMKVDDFAKDPQGYLFKMHNSIRQSVNAELDRRSPIIIPGRPSKSTLNQAILREKH